MLAVKAYYDGKAFIPLSPVNVKLNQSAIITILEESIPNESISNPLEKFFGCLTGENYTEIVEALKEAERVDINEW